MHSEPDIYLCCLCYLLSADSLRSGLEEENQRKGSLLAVYSKHACHVSILGFGWHMHIHLTLTKQIAVHPTLWPQSQLGEADSSLTQIRVN